MKLAVDVSTHTISCKIQINSLLFKTRLRTFMFEISATPLPIYQVSLKNNNL